MAEFVPPAGPVDIAVVGFPDQAPGEKVTAALADAVASGAVRVLDALVVQKADDGSVTVVDVDDPDDALDLLGYPPTYRGC